MAEPGRSKDGCRRHYDGFTEATGHSADKSTNQNGDNWVNAEGNCQLALTMPQLLSGRGRDRNGGVHPLMDNDRVAIELSQDTVGRRSAIDALVSDGAR